MIWKAIAIFLFLAGVYYAGGVSPRSELTEYRATVAAEKQAEKDKADRQDRQSKQLINELEAKHANDIAAIDAAWAGRLRNEQAKGRGFSIAPGLCNDTDRDKRLSGAVSDYRDEITAAIGEFRNEAADLLRIADRQTATLRTCQAWAAGDQLIRAP